jgi:hypothetical protein
LAAFSKKMVLPTEKNSNQANYKQENAFIATSKSNPHNSWL